VIELNGKILSEDKIDSLAVCYDKETSLYRCTKCVGRTFTNVSDLRKHDRQEHAPITNLDEFAKALLKKSEEK
jgi:hypothetical protein